MARRGGLYRCAGCGVMERHDPRHRPPGGEPVWREYPQGRFTYVVRWECQECAKTGDEGSLAGTEEFSLFGF